MSKKNNVYYGFVGTILRNLSNAYEYISHELLIVILHLYEVPNILNRLTFLITLIDVSKRQRLAQRSIYGMI